MTSTQTATKESRTRRKSRFSGIPLQGMESVKGALQTFAAGKTNSSYATNDKLIRDSEAGAMIHMFKTVLFDSNSQDMFMNRLFAGIQQGMDKNGRFHVHYDYDGQGRFFKTSVTVKRIDVENDIYLLSLNAAYVGSQIEDELAKYLGVEQGLNWVAVEVDFPTQDRTFRFDFEEIINTAKQALPEISKIGEAEVTAEYVLDSITARSQFEEVAGNALLLMTDNYKLTVGPADVARANEYVKGKLVENWKREGSILTGPIRNSYDEPPVPLTPQIGFAISPVGEDKYDTNPVIDPAVKQQMYELADRIEKAFA